MQPSLQHRSPSNHCGWGGIDQGLNTLRHTPLFSDFLQRSAEYAAYLHFLARCYDLNILAEISDRSSPLQSMNKEVTKRRLQDKKDSVVDMFNYAARYDAVPSVETSRIVHKHGGRTRQLFETIVKVQDFDVQVVGHGIDPQAAEIDAALKFKAEAERYQASKGKSSLVIKDFKAPTIDDAEKFKEFMQIVRPGIHIEVKSETRPGDTVKVQALVNDAATGEGLQMARGKRTETMALLAACITLKKEDPTLWPRYLRALQYGNGQILKPIAPMDISVDEDCSLLMRETLLGARRIGLPDEVADAAPLQLNTDGRRDANLKRLAPGRAEDRSEKLSRKLEELQTHEKFQERRRQKAELPINQYRSDVLNLVNNNDYSIVVGATGSGKTTQVPQILLEDAISQGDGSACNIICTQPRRIAATSVARRVAVERAEDLQWSVGYIVRFDSRPPKASGGMCYCTTGILLQQLQHTPDEVMDHVTHLVIDEVHERDVLIDFLLILLKKNMARRKLINKRNPKVVLMSATMDTELFANYFGKDEADGTSSACPSIDVPGRMFPVKERYLDQILDEIKEAKTSTSVMHSDVRTRDFIDSEKEFQRNSRSEVGQRDQPESTHNPGHRANKSVIDWRRESDEASDYRQSTGSERNTGLVPYGLISTTIAHIARTTTEGAILVFLPGLEEIVRVDADLSKPGNFGIDFNDRTRYQRYILHSSVSQTQQSVFDAVPVGCRKIILATNIAETSVTIPDVQHVVDAGKLREKQYDQERRITSLVCTWESKSNSRQRSGRAGRVQDGNYYALFSRERAESLRAIGLPELLRTDLQEVCLDVKAQAFQEPIREFLAEAIEPPAARNVDASVYNLQALDAITETEEITALGQLLASIPVHPSLGKMIILGTVFRCLDPMLILGAAGNQRSVFVNPLTDRAEARASKMAFAQGSQSDHIALLNAVRELRHWRHLHGEQAMREFARSHFLHVGAFSVIDSTAQQIETILKDGGLIPFTPAHQRHNFQYGDHALNENSHKIPLIKALVLAGLHPNLAVSPYGGMLFRTPNEKNVMVHPSSLNSDPERFRARKDAERKPPTYHSYTSLSKSNDGNSMFIRDTSEITPLLSCLFGGRLSQNQQRPNVLEMDDWLPFYIVSQDKRTTKTVLEFRKGLERLLMLTFRDLETVAKTRRTGRDATEQEESFLADDEVRRYFAAGLVEV